MRKITVLFCCVFLPCFVWGQKDTLFEREAHSVQSPFNYFDLLRTYSKKNDSLIASKYLQCISPLYFVSMGLSPEKLDTLLSEHALIQNIKSTYLKLYIKVYFSDKKDEFAIFKQMYEEDQFIRHSIINTNNDPERVTKLENEMSKTDSVHFIYLYQYVKKSGWPSIENGGLFAKILALHDHVNHQFYLPYLKKAVLDGNMSIVFYNSLSEMYYHEHEGRDIKTNNKIKTVIVDVSELLKQGFLNDTTVIKIESAFKLHCPFIYVTYIYETSKQKDYDNFVKSNNQLDNNRSYEILVDKKFTTLNWPAGCMPLARYFQPKVIESSINRLKLVLSYYVY